MPRFFNEGVSDVEGENKKPESLLQEIELYEEAQMSKGTIEIGMNRYLEAKARERGIPIRGTFELTPLCNLDCKMCYIHLSGSQLQHTGNGLLSGDEWIAIMDQAVEAGILTALLTGGEAMMHPEFERIFLHLQSKGLNVCLITNGILLTEKRIEFFKKNKPKEIRVTLYGADEETYEKVTGHRVFSTVVDNIRRAKEAGLHLGVNITPNRYMNVNDCLALIDLADSLGIAYMLNTSLSDPREGTGREHEEHDFSLDQYIELYKFLKLKRNEEIHSVCAGELPDIGVNCREEKGIRCGAGRSSFAVLWHGNMQGCLSLSDKQFDLRVISFADAWRCLNQMAREYPVPRQCQNCAYKHLCTVCVVRHAEGAPLGHANPLLCERAKRMVAEGLSTLS